jgi:hypothetical protein
MMRRRDILTGLGASALLVPNARADIVMPFLIKPPPLVRQSDVVADAVGINTHMSFSVSSGNPYQNFDTLVRPMLQQLGVRYIRDWVIPNTGGNAYYYTRLQTLLGDGIRSSLILFDMNVPSVNVDPSALAGIVAAAGGSILYVEGANEPDAIPGWATITGPRQILTYNTIKGSPGSFPGVQVLGPGLANLGGPSLQIGNIGPYVDHGNWHPYPGGDSAPERISFLANYIKQATNQTYSGSTLIVTEDGYNSALSSGAVPAPNAIIARWLPRMILFNLLSGVSKTFLYELICLHNGGLSQAQSNWGLVPYVAAGDPTPGSPLPQFFAIQNLISLFADPGVTFFTTPMAYSISRNGSNPSPTNIFSAAFQKRDGSYLLPVWIGQPSSPLSFNHWNVGNQGATNIVTAQIINVNLPATVSSVLVYTWADDGTVSTSTMSPTAGVLAFTATDSLQVLKFTV